MNITSCRTPILLALAPVAAASALLTALVTAHPAHAVTVVGPSWDHGVDVHLTAAESYSAARDGIYTTGDLCTKAINQALAAGVGFPDRARSSCANALTVCAREAAAANRALSAARLYADGTSKCLVV